MTEISTLFVSESFVLCNQSCVVDRMVKSYYKLVCMQLWKSVVAELEVQMICRLLSIEHVERNGSCNV